MDVDAGNKSGHDVEGNRTGRENEAWTVAATGGARLFRANSARYDGGGAARVPDGYSAGAPASLRRTI